MILTPLLTHVWMDGWIALQNFFSPALAAESYLGSFFATCVPTITFAQESDDDEPATTSRVSSSHVYSTNKKHQEAAIRSDPAIISWKFTRSNSTKTEIECNSGEFCGGLSSGAFTGFRPDSKQ